MRKFLRNHAGGALTEFATSAPLLLLLTAGTVDTGHFMWGGILVSNAARAGAVYGAQNLGTAADATGIKAAAMADAPKLASLLTVTSSSYCACDSASGTAVACNPNPCVSPDVRDTFVKVTVTANFGTIVSWPGLGSGLTVTKTNIQQVTN